MHYKPNWDMPISINLTESFSLSWIFVIKSVSKKFKVSSRQNGWTDRVQFFCEISRDPREDFWMINFQKFASIKIRFLKILKVHEIFFYKIREIVCFCFINKENPHVVC